MAILSDEKVASLTRRLVDTVIDYKKEAERLAIENEKLRAALGNIARMKVLPDDKVNRMTLVAAIEIARAALQQEER